MADGRERVIYSRIQFAWCRFADKRDCAHHRTRVSAQPDLRPDISSGKTSLCLMMRDTIEENAALDECSQGGSALTAAVAFVSGVSARI